jgi:hypothetical protein
MDKVYVIYFDGNMYKTNSRKTAYLEEKYAKQVITAEAKEIATNTYNLSRYDWWELNKKEQQEYIDSVKKRFEIREFVERKEQ